jgi:hypothetical protein
MKLQHIAPELHSPPNGKSKLRDGSCCPGRQGTAIEPARERKPGLDV